MNQGKLNNEINIKNNDQLNEISNNETTNTKKESSLSPQEKEWKETCMNFAELLYPKIEEMMPNPFNAQIRKNKIVDLSTVIASNELVEILIEGFKILDSHQNQNPSLKEFLVQYEERMTRLEALIQKSENNQFINLSELLNLDEKLVNDIENFAQEEFKNGNVKDASSVFAVIAILKNFDAKPWFDLGFSLYQEGKYQLATRSAETAHALLPNQIEYTLFLIVCYDALGQKEQAHPLLEQIKQEISTSDVQLSNEWKDLYNELTNKIKIK